VSVTTEQIDAEVTEARAWLRRWSGYDQSRVSTVMHESLVALSVQRDAMREALEAIAVAVAEGREGPAILALALAALDDTAVAS